MSTVTIPRIGGYQRPAVMDWLTTVDHKKLGILYLWFTLFFFAVGGIFALLVRTQLAVGENTFLANDAYNQIFTMHASSMLFLFIIPIWLASVTILYLYILVQWIWPSHELTPYHFGCSLLRQY